MASADLQAIYNRLNSVSGYHPYSAETFSDWSMEAGDTVTVSRNGTEYKSPVHNSTVKWTGSQKVSIESRGEKTRGSITKMSIDSYNSDSSGGNSYRYSYGNSKMTDELGTRIDNNENEILLEAWNRKNADDIFESRLNITAEQITAEVKNRKKDGELIRGEISVEAGRINQMVKAVGANGEITAASICLAITKAGSLATISAKNIVLSGTTTLNDVMSVDSQAVRINRRLYIGSGSSITQIYPTFMSTQSILCNGVAHNVANASVSGNVLTITFSDGRPNLTFSKATTLSGEWSGNIQAGKSYKVTAKQNGVVVGSPHYSPSLDGYAQGTRYWSGNSLLMPVTVYDANGTDLFRDDVDVTGAYNDGASSASHNIDIPSSQIYTTSGSPPSGSTNLSTMKSRVLTAIDDSETLVFRVDCGGTSKYYHMNF